MKALVSGSAGFVGRHIDRALVDRGYEVHGADTTLAGAARLDCRDVFRTDASFDLVIHCAALVDGRETIEHKAALIAAYNLQLDGAMFEWALRTKPGRVVYFSSSAVYPTELQVRARRLRETDFSYQQAPDQTYGWVKMTGELMAEQVRGGGVPVTVVRPFSGYGEDQDACYPFPAIIARAVRKQRPFTVWGDGTQVRDFIHISDIVNATLTLIDQQIDGPVNLGTGRATSMDQLAAMAMKAANHTAEIKHLTDKPAGVAYRVTDPRALHQYYRPKVSLQEGIARACSTLRRVLRPQPV